MTSSRRIYRKLDWVIIACYVILAVFGWLNIYASTWSEDSAGIFSLATRSGNQLVWIGISALSCIVTLLLNPRFFKTMAWPVYITVMVMLIAVLLFGHEVNGSKSWLSFGFFAIQPSEFSKIATALCLSSVMGGYNFKLSNTGDFMKAAAIISVPVILIALEPDIGTILVYCGLAFMLYREGLPGIVLGFAGFAILVFLLTLKFSPFVSILAAVAVIGIAMSASSKTPVKILFLFALFITAAAFIPKLLDIPFIAGFNKLDEVYWLLVLLGITIIPATIYAVRHKIRNWYAYLVPLLLSIVLVFSVELIFNKVLKPHHRDRIENLLGISEDIQGAGYNVHQSKIAIGSGGLTGKGFLEGTQTKYNFVPEQSTDFIFCTIGEEWGFVGSAIVLGLFLIIILRIITSAERQKDKGIRVYGYCIASFFFMHVIINVGMTIGIMPVVGIPLPLISYGGSSFLTFSVLLFIYLRFDLERWR